MGRPTIAQSRGKGGPAYKAPSHRFKTELAYRNLEGRMMRAEVIDFIDDPARTGLLMLVQYEDGVQFPLLSPEGAKVGDIIEDGPGAKKEIGSVLPLSEIPEGYPIFNVEKSPGKGGAIVRSSGTCAFIVTKSAKNVVIKFPSGKTKAVNPKCRASIGCVCGGGRTDKPLLKAGANFYKNKAKNHWWPRVRGVHMNAVDHPFGGKQHHGAITMKGKGGAPGQHVGSFGAKRTGRRKR